MPQKTDSIEQETVNERKTKLIDVLKLVSPGTSLRTAIDDILRAGMGALIVVTSPEVKNLVEGGFRVNCTMTAQKIVELAKMDGAIVLSSDMKKILMANVLLVPDVSIPTNETGTRHKAAERTAREANTLAIAISERRKKISVYYGKLKYILQDTSSLMGRATENLQILEKQREIFDDLLSNLNVLEITSLVVFRDILAILQRIEMITKISQMINRYLVELGKEGVIIKMRLRELLRNVEKEKQLIFQDYVIEKSKLNSLSELGFEDLLDIDFISSIFSASPDDQIFPSGYRILRKTNLRKEEIDKLISRFGNLNNILNANIKSLEEVLGDRANTFQREINNLKEQILVGKKI